MNKKKRILVYLIIIAVSLVLGVCLGFLISFIRESGIVIVPEISNPILIVIVFVVSLFAALVLQIFVHEFGHLVFGLATGYKFFSFRLFSLVILNNDGKIKLKKYSLAGTLGQCLMSPPKVYRDDMPVYLYNWGGVIFNVLFSVLALLISLFVFNVFSFPVLIFFILGLFFAFSNGVAFKNTPNDANNIKSMKENPKNKYYLWLQLRANEELIKGKALTDFPEEYFVMPTKEEIKSPLALSIATFVVSREMGLHNFDKALENIDFVLDNSPNIITLFKHILVIDKLYIKLLRDDENVEEILTDEFKTFLKQMKANPSVQRTNYALQKLYYRNELESAKTIVAFEKAVKGYQYPTEEVSERKLIELINQKAST